MQNDLETLNHKLMYNKLTTVVADNSHPLRQQTHRQRSVGADMYSTSTVTSVAEVYISDRDTTLQHVYGCRKLCMTYICERDREIDYVYMYVCGCLCVLTNTS